MAMTAAMACVFAVQVAAYHRNARVVARDFYGSLRVVESDGVRRLYHGTIEHGSQFTDAARRNLPTSYYGPDSGVGLALRFCCDGSKKVGVVGLGAGTLAAYGRAGDRMRFYEIDPEVVSLARSEFSFLRETAANVEIAKGDARLTLEHDDLQSFDVLVIDAFSGDAIPVHLLTAQAFELYTHHLKPSGILAIHISNQYLDLAPVVARLAPGAVEVQTRKDASRDLAAATWMLITDNTDFLRRAGIARANRPAARGRIWTDDYNNLFDVLRW
jgi:SAM-dependent methyltransferase